MSPPLSFGLIGAGWIGSFHAATLTEFAHFAGSALAGTETSVTGIDARTALEIALAASESIDTKAPVALNGVLA
jgi:myo-inositol 2-dehydrogenase / D-chiro-inositol 1-dehydrogenase